MIDALGFFISSVIINGVNLIFGIMIALWVMRRIYVLLGFDRNVN